MNTLSPLLAVIFSAVLGSASLAQTPDENNKSEGEVTPSESDVAAEDETAPPDPANEAFQRALEHASNNELDEAIAECTEAIRLDPKNMGYLTGRAELYFATREFDKGVADADKILETAPNDLAAHHLRGKIFEVSGETDKALAEFDAAVERNPASMEALLERHNYFTRQGQQEKAAADADRMIQLEPQSPQGYMARGLISTAAGDGDEAFNYAERVLQQDPESWQAYTMRAGARGLKRDFKGASEDYEAALKLSPDNAVILNARAMCNLDRGEYQQSLADMERAVELDPQNYLYKVFVADVLATCPDERFRDGKKANEYAAAAFKAAPNDPDVWSAYAAAAAENGNFEEAINWQQRVNQSTLRSDPRADRKDRLEAYKAKQPYRDLVASRIANKTKMEQAVDAINGGKLERAIALLSEIIDADPKKVPPRRLRGIAYFRLQEHERAITDLTAAIERDPRDADAYRYRGHAYYLRREYVKARGDFQKWEKLNSPRDSAPLNQLAWFYSTCPDDDVRDSGKASEYVDRALELESSKPEIWDTCAAVFAETGDFEDAVEWEQAYLDSADASEKQRLDGEKRLDLYRKGRPYREEPEDLLSEQPPKNPEQGNN